MLLFVAFPLIVVVIFSMGTPINRREEMTTPTENQLVD